MTEADRRPRDSAIVLIAALIYVGAWIVGLLVAPSAPSETAADQKVQAFFVAHHGSTLVQALLVHGIAGLAFFVFVISLAKLMPSPGSGAMRTVFLVAGMAAVIVSLVQVGLEIGLNRHVASGGGASTTASLFHAVNVADTIKLALLGIAIAAAARVASETGLFARWLVLLGYALLPILIIGGLAFVIHSDTLNAVLDLSLVLLLVWVGGVGIVTARRAKPGRRSALA